MARTCAAAGCSLRFEMGLEVAKEKKQSLNDEIEFDGGAGLPQE
jgi:hypothetical protein